VNPRFQPAFRLPEWLADQMPFNRRVFSDAGRAMHFVDEGRGAPVATLVAIAKFMSSMGAVL